MLEVEVGNVEFSSFVFVYYNYIIITTHEYYYNKSIRKSAVKTETNECILTK